MADFDQPELLVSRWWKHFGHLSGSCSLHRQLRFFSANRLGYIDTPLPFMLLFTPHLAFAIGIMLFGLALPALKLLAMAGVIPDQDYPFIVLSLLLSVVMIAFGGLFTTVLGALILARRRTIIDTQAGTLRESTGLALPLVPLLFLPLAWRRHRLDRFTKVLVQVKPPAKRSQSRFATLAVSLSHESTDDTSTPAEDRLVQVACVVRYLAARRLAERLAAVSGLPIDDRAYGDAAVRSAAERDRPLIDTLAHQPDKDLPTAAPSGSLRILSELPLIIAMPRPELSRPWLFRFGLGCAIAAIVAALVFGLGASEPIRPPTPTSPSETLVEGLHYPSLWPWRWAYAGWWLQQSVGQLAAITAMIAGLILLGMAWLRPRDWRVEVQADALVINRRQMLWWKRLLFPYAQLEELRQVVDGEHAVLMAISDQHIATFPERLTRSDARWLRDRLLAAMAAIRATR